MSEIKSPIKELEQTKTALATLQGEFDAQGVELSTTKTALATLQGQFDAYKSEASTSKSALSSDLIKANDALVAEKLELSKARLAVATAQADLSKANGELTPLKEKFDQAVVEAGSKKAAEATAAIGVDPVKTDVNTKQEKTEPKQNGLTGLQRFAAVAEVEAGAAYAKAHGIRERK